MYYLSLLILCDSLSNGIYYNNYVWVNAFVRELSIIIIWIIYINLNVIDALIKTFSSETDTFSPLV